jgi:PhoH-like ATPase
MAKKIYVLDTSVYLTDFRVFYSYGNNDIAIPLIVLEEIDRHKKRPNGVGINARQTIRILDGLREKGLLHKGVRIEKGKGIAFSVSPNLDELPTGYDPSIPDHQIIASALTLKNENPNRKVVLVSNDINLRIKCDAIGVAAEDYLPENVIENGNELYSGFSDMLVDDQIIDRIYEGEEIYLEDISENKCLYSNQFVMMVSSANEKKTALTRFINEHEPFKKVRDHKTGESWGIGPKNKEQNFAMDLLYDNDVPVVSLIGKAGSGKTLCAIASGLEQVIGQDPKYNRLIVSRPVMPMGKSSCAR